MAKNKILQAVVDVAGSIDPSLGKTVDSAVKHLDKINWKATAVAAAAGGIAIATGKAVMEAGKYLLDLGSQFDSAADAIRIGTGATGEALEALNMDFDAVYKSVPTTMEDASKAIADYNTLLGLTGEPLQEISKQAIQVSDMLGDDLGGVIENSSKAFQQWNIDADKMGEGMDYIFKLSQSTGMGFTEIMSSMQKFGPQLQEMGYGFETASALMGQMEKAGVNTEEVLGAMKKSVGALAKEGINASDGLAYYYEQIKNAGTAAEATAIANELFGSKAGSTMAAAIRDGTLAVGELSSELLANGETISGAAEDTYDFAERLQLFRQNAEVALKPLANTVFDSINNLMPPLTKAMESLAPAIGSVVEITIPLVTELFDGLLPIIEELLPVILDLAKNLLAKLIPPVMKIINSLLPAIMTLLDALMPILDLLIELLDPILNLIAELIVPILDLIISAISPLIKIIAELINAALKPLMPIIEILGEFFKGVLGEAIAGIQPIIESLMDIFGGLITFITGTMTGDWEKAWSGIVEVFKSVVNAIPTIFEGVINAIVGIINGVLSGLNTIKLPDWVPGLGGKGINIPLIPTVQLPRFESGGFTDGISIAGEAGMEAVISFDPKYRKDNIAYWAQAGEMLGVDLSNIPNDITRALHKITEQPSSIINNIIDIPTEPPPIENILKFENIITITKDFLSGLLPDKSELSQGALTGQLISSTEENNINSLSHSGNTTIVYELGGVTFAPRVEVYGKADEENIIRQIREREPEFFDFLENWLSRREAGRYETEDSWEF